jgi:flagellar FliJ protein
VKREHRLRPLVSLATQTERDRASRLVEAERRLGEAIRRLEELVNFRHEYERTFHERATSGAEMRSLRESRLFIASLDDAVHAQEGQRGDLRERLLVERQSWGEAATRKKVVAKVVEKVRAEAAARAARFLQAEMDESASHCGVPL